MTEFLEQAFRFKQWADLRTLAAAKQIDQRRYPEALAFIRQQLNHLVIVQDLFRARLRNEPRPHEATNSQSVPSLSSLENRLLESNNWYLDFVQTRDMNRDQELLRFEFTDGKAGAMTRHEILFHIVNHGSYHRGSMARGLDLGGVAHPADIFTMYLHDVEPERRD